MSTDLDQAISRKDYKIFELKADFFMPDPNNEELEKHMIYRSLVDEVMRLGYFKTTRSPHPYDRMQERVQASFKILIEKE